MKCVIVLSFILSTVGIFISTATEIFYVLPDNSTNASCPSQPCATLSQYWLHNGTLPVVSNVAYHFLPGEHHVPANMTLQNLHNFSIIGAIRNSSLPTVLIGCSQSFYAIYISDSFFVSITNVKFKHCSILPNNVTRPTLKLFCCFSCKIENVTFVQYGIVGYNLIGRSYLNNVKVETIQSSKVCHGMILLQHSICPPRHTYSNCTHDLTINQLYVQNCISVDTSTYENAGLQINLDTTTYHVNTLLTNSEFHGMNRPALVIKNRYSHTRSYVFIINCTFELITAKRAIKVYASLFNKTVRFINCEFHDNMGLITIAIVVCRYPNECELIVNATNALLSANKILTNISFVKCQFISNVNEFMVVNNKYPILSNFKANILFESLIISHNYPSRGSSANIISITTMNVHINGTFNVTNNRCKQAIVQFWSCDVLFSGTMVFFRNICKGVISTNTHIKVMEYTNITFFKNICENNVILVETSVEYYQPYPFCLFQYITMNNNTKTKDLLAHYAIVFRYNHKSFI